MKRYLIQIDSTEERYWKEFRKIYKQRELGQNINEAIITLIKNEVAKEG